MQLHNLDLNKLHAFFAVADEGGVGRAARRLGRTSSAVSQSVAALERALGCKLFDRIGRRLVPTRGGRELYELLREQQTALGRLVAELAGGGEVRGLVRVGCFLGFPRVRLAALAVRFGEAYPQASLRISYAPQDELEERLRRNRLDFVFSLRPESGESPALVSTRLFAQELVLVAARSLVRRGLTPKNLSGVPVIDYYQSDPLIGRWLEHHYGAKARPPAVRYWAATTDLVLDLVLRGAGVAVLPRDVAHPALRSGAIRALGPRGRPMIDHVWLKEPHGAYRDATLEAFRGVVMAELA